MASTPTRPTEASAMQFPRSASVVMLVRHLWFGADGYESVMAARRCHELYADNFQPKADNPLHKPAQGGLVGQFGAEDGRVRARADLAFVELCTERSVRLAGENDLVCARSH
jgi:hypothetical protein